MSNETLNKTTNFKKAVERKEALNLNLTLEQSFALNNIFSELALKEYKEGLNKGSEIANGKSKIDRIIIEDNLPVAKIFDEEGDLVNLDFMNDGCVTIDTSKLNHLVFDEDTLLLILRLFDESKIYFKENEK